MVQQTKRDAMIKNILAAILLCSAVYVNAAPEQNENTHTEGILYTEAVAREFAKFNMIFACAVVRDKFYSEVYKDHIVEKCDKDVESVSKKVKNQIFEDSISKMKSVTGMYNIRDLVFIGKYHFIMSCFSTHQTVSTVEKSEEKAIIEDCANLSQLVNVLAIQRFTSFQKKKKTT